MNRLLGSARNKWLLFSLAAVVLFYAGLNWWLTSELGRGVVESRLSSALGRPVILEGEFRHAFLPMPGADGTELKILSPDGRWMVLEAGQYLVRVSLWPLLKGEIEVAALRIEDASVDLMRMLDTPDRQAHTNETPLNIPSIQGFDLENVSLFFDGLNSGPYLQIEKMKLRDLEPGVAAAFSSQLVFHSGEAAMGRVETAGSLRLDSDGSIAVEIENLDVGLFDWVVRDIDGNLFVSLARSAMSIDLVVAKSPLDVEVAVRMGWKPMFPENQPGYSIEKLEARIGDQLIGGSGCVLEKSRLELHLEMEAGHLSLDDIEELMANWHQDVPGRPAIASEDSADAASIQESGPDLPFDLAVLLKVDVASYGDTTAEGIRFRAGAFPDCPSQESGSGGKSGLGETDSGITMLSRGNEESE